MGTKVQSKSYLPGYHSMRDLNDDSNSFNWPLYYGDKTLPNGKYYSGFLPGVSDSYPGHDKDVVKRTMLEHEAIFKNQVYELHRVYRIQRDLMNEVKRKEFQQNRIPIETSLSSSPLASQVTSEDARKWNIPSFPFSNSISGAEDLHSPFKGNSAQNGSSSKSKDNEVLESRPTKVRRKMFDLHLPADEYIDTEEGEQNGCERDASRSDSSLKSDKGLADLNEPVMAEETHAPAYVNLLSTSGNKEIRGHELSAKPNSQFLGVAKDISANSHVGSSNGTTGNLYMDNNGNGRVWYPHGHVHKTGQSKNNLKSASQGYHLGKLSMSSHPIQALLNKAHEPSVFQTDQSKIDLHRERTNCGLGTSGTSRDASTYIYQDSFLASHTPGLRPSPDLAKSWSQQVSSWGKLNSSLSQRSTPVQSHRIFGDMHHITSNSGANQNGFYHGSSSGSKLLQVPLSSVNHGYLNCDTVNGVSDLFATHGSSKYSNGSSCGKSAKGMDLNVVLSTTSPNETGFVDGERDHKDHFPGLPWLKSKPVSKNEATNSGRDFNKWEQSFFHSATNQLSGRNENVETVGGSNNKKILGFPIFEKPCTSEKKGSVISYPSLLQPPETAQTNKKSRLLDINLPCDAVVVEDEVIEKTDEKVSAFRCLIDLNSCLSEDEASPVPFDPNCGGKTMTQIDLEVPAVPESEEEEETPQLRTEQDELVKKAAEAIVGISSFVHKSNVDVNIDTLPEASMPDPLNWFVEIASTCGTDIDCKLNGDSSSEAEEVDFFEYMTLKLKETKEEDYMPESLVMDNPQVEETGSNLLTTRPRRGQARRGRQRRDFQRDILPGLTTLSRHEVTEDLQTFGGMMLATGHLWQTRVTRRNGGGRGRRKTVVASTPVVAAIPACTMLTQQVNNVQVVGVQERSLTGWGKTIRRPRRQRCPAGNLQPVPLS